jgi:hypothetical protein
MDSPHRSDRQRRFKRNMSYVELHLDGGSDGGTRVDILVSKIISYCDTGTGTALWLEGMDPLKIITVTESFDRVRTKLELLGRSET